MLREFTPVVTIDGPDGIVMDNEGADHLRGGESPMLTGVCLGTSLELLADLAAATTDYGGSLSRVLTLPCDRRGNLRGRTPQNILSVPARSWHVSQPTFPESRPPFPALKKRPDL